MLDEFRPFAANDAALNPVSSAILAQLASRRHRDAGAKLINSPHIEDRWIAYISVVL